MWYNNDVVIDYGRIYTLVRNKEDQIQFSCSTGDIFLSHQKFLNVFCNVAWQNSNNIFDANNLPRNCLTFLSIY